MLKIRVLSFDFDGCLFHEGYCQSEIKDVVALNQDLLDSIKTSKQPDEMYIVFVGSARQSRQTDKANHLTRHNPPIQVGSCYPAIERVSEYLDARLDPFLLADVYSGNPSGHEFRVAQEKHIPSATERQKTEIGNVRTLDRGWAFDLSKLSIVYAQIHKIASEYPNAFIQYDFYDDREDILSNLSRYLRFFSPMLPYRVSLNFHQYSGVLKKNSHLSAIGTGVIDGFYRKTLMRMLELARENSTEKPGVYTFSNHVSPVKLLLPLHAAEFSDYFFVDECAQDEVHTSCLPGAK